MAITTKRPALVKRSSGKVAKSGVSVSSGKGTEKIGLTATTGGPLILSEESRSEDPVAVTELAVAAVEEVVVTDAPAADETDQAKSPEAGLADAQIRTLADLCKALDKKCLELLEDVAAAREAQAASEPVIAELKEAVAQERGRREVLVRELAEARRGHERELAEARRSQAALEREIAALRLVMERSNRPTAMARKPVEPAAPLVAKAPAAANTVRANGEHAARLLPILQQTLASGAMTAVHDTARALARFRVAGMIDAIEGTREAPVCRGWLLSRSDLQAVPLMFLMDDVGLLGWTDASTQRPDVNGAFPNTKPRPGFQVSLSRMPVGRLRGLVAVKEVEGDGAVFFEAARKAIPKGHLA